MGCRCFWDPKTDDYAQQVFSDVSQRTLFCQAYGASTLMLNVMPVAGDIVLCCLSIWCILVLKLLSKKVLPAEVETKGGYHFRTSVKYWPAAAVMGSFCFSQPSSSPAAVLLPNIDQNTV